MEGPQGQDPDGAADRGEGRQRAHRHRIAVLRRQVPRRGRRGARRGDRLPRRNRRPASAGGPGAPGRAGALRGDDRGRSRHRRSPGGAARRTPRRLPCTTSKRRACAEHRADAAPAAAPACRRLRLRPARRPAPRSPGSAGLPRERREGMAARTRNTYRDAAGCVLQLVRRAEPAGRATRSTACRRRTRKPTRAGNAGR